MSIDNTLTGIFRALIFALIGALFDDLPETWILAGVLAGAWSLASTSALFTETWAWAGASAGALAYAKAYFYEAEALGLVLFFGVIGAIAGGISVLIWGSNTDSVWIGALVGSGVSNFVWSALIAQSKIECSLTSSLTRSQISGMSALIAISGIGSGWLVRAFFLS